MSKNNELGDQLRGYLELILEHFKTNGILEVNGGNAWVTSDGHQVPTDEVKRLISLGYLRAHGSREATKSPYEAGHTYPLFVYAPGSAWWSEKEKENAIFLADQMEALASANAALQKQLAESSDRLNRSVRWINVSAVVIGFCTLIATVFWMGETLHWW